MTLAIGMSCPEGAVLVVDSARSAYFPDGSVSVDVVDDKMLFFGSDRIVAVHQGCSPPERGVVKLAEYHDDFDTAARLIFGHLSKAEYAESVPERYRSGHHVICAGAGRHGEPVRMVSMRTGHHPEYAPQQGALFVAGDATTWKGGATLTDCLHKATRLAAILMRSRIEAAGRLEQPSGVAWPLHVAVIDPYYLQLETLEEEDAPVGLRAL